MDKTYSESTKNTNETSEIIEQDKLLKSQSEILEIVIHNLFRMLVNRGLINEINISEYVKTAIKNYDHNYETTIKLDKTDSENIGASHIAIKFVLRKITAISKETDIDNFIKQNYYKFLIKTSMPTRITQQLLKNQQLEIFDINELKLDLFQYELVPNHRKMTEIEITEFLLAHKFTRANMKQICYDDPVCKYLNVKPNDILEIKRPTITSGYELDYRLVSHNAQPI